MAAKRYNENELYDFAAQILLEEKTWDDFDFLHPNDKTRVEFIVSRGKKALVQQRSKQEKYVAMNPHNLRKIVSTSYEERHPDKREEEKKRRIAVTKLAQRAGFTVFPLNKLENETGLLRRKLMEALNRRLVAKDFALLFTTLLGGEADFLLSVVSDNLSQDIRFHMENEKELEEWTDYDANAVYAKFSISSATYLSTDEDVSADLKQVLADYLEALFGQLQEYCCGLPKKLGIVDSFAQFDQTKWRKLAGLTPRQDMAILSFVVDKQLFDQMINCLPAVQKEDVNQAIQYFERSSEGDIEFFVKVLEVLKHWAVTVSKLIEEDGDGEG
ncbi:hypothetical protein SCG7109_AE_00060 [Chlamydiales bacterium SCGC AG-110-M15]|nr:hypothetical protein SCG7109_AE_00060 [Chlamydiales bacterium SCGC AG-110-M15]